MDEFVKKERELLLAGAKGVYIMPYPYRKGHFCVFSGEGKRTFVSMEDDVFRRAIAAWGQLNGDVLLTDDVTTLRLLTYDKLLQNRKAGERALSADERLLVRAAMDRHLAGMRDIAAGLISEIYSGNLREDRSGYPLRQVVRRLL